MTLAVIAQVTLAICALFSIFMAFINISLQPLRDGIKKLEKGQESLEEDIKGLKDGQRKLEEGQRNLEQVVLSIIDEIRALKKA